MRRVLILNVLLLAVVAALVVQIVALWWGTEVEVEPAAPREAKAPRLEIPPPVRRPPQPPDLAEAIATADLFDPSRSAETAASAPMLSDEPLRPLTVTLLGVMVVEGEREALVKEQSEPKPVWLRQGEQIGGYKVGRIDPMSVVMVAPNGDEVAVMLNVEKARAGAPPLGPAGLQPRPTQAARVAGTPVAARTPSPDIKEKIERLRREARRRRAQQREEQ